MNFTNARATDVKFCDLRSKADRIKIDESVIGLFVDAQNTAAAKMYTDEGFVKIDRRDDMDRMILAL